MSVAQHRLTLAECLEALQDPPELPPDDRISSGLARLPLFQKCETSWARYALGCSIHRLRDVPGPTTQLAALHNRPRAELLTESSKRFSASKPSFLYRFLCRTVISVCPRMENVSPARSAVWGLNELEVIDRALHYMSSILDHALPT